MAIAEDRLKINNIVDVTKRRFDSIKDSDAVKQIKSLSDKAGSTIEGLNKRVGNVVGNITGLLTNTSNTINGELSLFQNVACTNIDPLDIRLGNYFSSLSNALNFRINSNMCNGCVGANPIGSILKSITNGDGLSSVIPGLKSDILDGYFNNKVNSIVNQLGIPSDISRCMLEGSSSRFNRSNYGGYGSLRSRLDLAAMVRGSVCGTTPISKSSMLGSNNTLNTYVASTMVDKLSRYNYEAGAGILIKAIENGSLSREDVLNGLVDSINNDRHNILKKLQILDIVANQGGKDRDIERLYSNLDANSVYRLLKKDSEVLDNMSATEYGETLGLLDKLDMN